MRRLSFSDWVECYGDEFYDEYEEYEAECRELDNIPMDWIDFLEDKYIESISEFEDMEYERMKEERHFNG